LFSVCPACFVRQDSSKSCVVRRTRGLNSWLRRSGKGVDVDVGGGAWGARVVWADDIREGGKESTEHTHWRSPGRALRRSPAACRHPRLCHRCASPHCGLSWSPSFYQSLNCRAMAVQPAHVRGRLRGVKVSAPPAQSDDTSNVQRLEYDDVVVPNSRGGTQSLVHAAMHLRAQVTGLREWRCCGLQASRCRFRRRSDRTPPRRT